MSDHQIIARGLIGVVVFLVPAMLSGAAMWPESKDQEEEDKAYRASLVIGLVSECLYLGIVLWK